MRPPLRREREAPFDRVSATSVFDFHFDLTTLDPDHGFVLFECRNGPRRDGHGRIVASAWRGRMEAPNDPSWFRERAGALTLLALASQREKLLRLRAVALDQRSHLD